MDVYALCECVYVCVCVCMCVCVCVCVSERRRVHTCERVCNACINTQAHLVRPARIYIHRLNIYMYVYTYTAYAYTEYVYEYICI